MKIARAREEAGQGGKGKGKSKEGERAKKEGGREGGREREQRIMDSLTLPHLHLAHNPHQGHLSHSLCRRVCGSGAAY